MIAIRKNEAVGGRVQRLVGLLLTLYAAMFET